MICVDCGFDTATADLASAMAVLGEAESRVAAYVDELRHRAATMETDPRDLARVLRLCDALEDARRALLGVPRRESRPSRSGDSIPMYSALSILSAEAAWLQRASTSVSPRSQASKPSPVLADTAHALEHATARLAVPYSAGETSPLS